jgi:hypothetical protein
MFIKRGNHKKQSTDKDIRVRNMKVSYGYSRIPQLYILIYYYKGDATAGIKNSIHLIIAQCTVHSAHPSLSIKAQFSHARKQNKAIGSVTYQLCRMLVILITGY